MLKQVILLSFIQFVFHQFLKSLPLPTVIMLLLITEIYVVLQPHQIH